MYLINNHSNGMPFLLYSVNIEDAKFPSVDTYETSILSVTIKNATGNSVDFNKRNSLFAAFGEFNERLSMYHSTQNSIPKIQAFSMNETPSTFIEPTKIYLNLNMKSLSGYDKEFQDSCGVASQINSNASMLASLLEFAERQSLIATWLGKQKRKRYKFKDILYHLNQNDILFSKTQTLMNKFSYFECYDISIFSNIYVLFIIGFNSEHYALGLSAGNSFLDAYSGALKEFFQCYFASQRIIGNTSAEKIDLYKDYYLNITIQDFYDSYKFLEESDTLYLHENDLFDLTDNQLCIQAILESFKMLGIHSYIVSIPPHNKQTRLKITKVYSPDAFPHMYVPLLEPERYRICKLLNMNKFPNKGKQIPFP
ncbi:YcaO-like family protein [Sporolactobacillus sp. CPB3-1]|uniref:YcaO-like family protein n=1 Tax=Sporolactobacillus mangiferae TaxID=2940498 RepID=A0ABT0M9Q8_9BACL|nr:YcaO-like family protein [Sporolactobacillus mangiferae]MCL1631599.1 YcaO-like family protein [Sporolactobacillus mangiferae]